MATYSATALGIKPPPGGFQEGGWYKGRQYIGGTLSEPGQIHPQSQQIGAGQDVSKTVNDQTNVANQPYIDAQKRQAAIAQPVAATQPVAAPIQQTQSFNTAGMTGGVPLPTAVTPTIDLPGLYQNLYDQSGVRDLETQLSKMTEDFTTARGKSNDNPFLSEATRVGREAKLQKLYDERTANIRNDIATRKADVETKLSLQMKQFDINSQQARQAQEQLNNLLSMGALDNASGETIANLTRSTGFTSDMIQGAINASKAKNVKTSLIQNTDNNGNVTVSVIDENTGNIIKQTSLGPVAKAEKATGTTGTGSTSSITKNVQQQFIQSADSTQGQQTEAGWVGIFPTLVAQYAPLLSLQDIYRLYSQSATGKKFGAPKESAAEIKQVYDAYRTGK